MKELVLSTTLSSGGEKKKKKKDLFLFIAQMLNLGTEWDPLGIQTQERFQSVSHIFAQRQIAPHSTGYSF